MMQKDIAVVVTWVPLEKNVNPPPPRICDSVATLLPRALARTGSVGTARTPKPPKQPTRLNAGCVEPRSRVG